MIDLSQNVQFVKGVGPNRAALLNSLGIYTLGVLITYFPREYEDRSKVKNIAELTPGEEVTIEATVTSEVILKKIRKNMTLLKATVEDNTGTCTLTWFNQTYVKQQIKRGQTYRFFGKVEKNLTQTEMRSPIYDEIGQQKNTGKIMPIYPSTYKLSQKAIRKAVENSLKMVESKIEETLPDYLLSEYHLEGLETSLQ